MIKKFLNNFIIVSNYINNKIKDKELPEVYDKIIGKNLLTRT